MLLRQVSGFRSQNGPASHPRQLGKVQGGYVRRSACSPKPSRDRKRAVSDEVRNPKERGGSTMPAARLISAVSASRPRKPSPRRPVPNPNPPAYRQFRKVPGAGSLGPPPLPHPINFIAHRSLTVAARFGPSCRTQLAGEFSLGRTWEAIGSDIDTGPKKRFLTRPRAVSSRQLASLESDHSLRRPLRLF